MRRSASLVSTSSSIANGGVSAREKTSSRSRHDLDGAGRQLGVDVGAARAHLAGDADAPLAAQLAATPCASALSPRLEDDLGEAAAVAQVDEHRAEIITKRKLKFKKMF